MRKTITSLSITTIATLCLLTAGEARAEVEGPDGCGYDWACSASARSAVDVGGEQNCRAEGRVATPFAWAQPPIAAVVQPNSRLVPIRSAWHVGC